MYFGHGQENELPLILADRSLVKTSFRWFVGLRCLDSGWLYDLDQLYHLSVPPFPYWSYVFPRVEVELSRTLWKIPPRVCSGAHNLLSSLLAPKTVSSDATISSQGPDPLPAPNFTSGNWSRKAQPQCTHLGTGPLPRDSSVYWSNPCDFCDHNSCSSFHSPLRQDQPLWTAPLLGPRSCIHRQRQGLEGC